MISKSLLIGEIILILFISSQSQEIGHECTVRKTGAAGTCAKVYSCVDAINDLKAGRNPTYCKVRSLTDVVCCPNEELNSFTRISDRKCAEYSEEVYETLHIPALVATGRTELVKKDKCGHKVLPLIVDGHTADNNEFPHMALLGFGETDTVWTCGGTLISELFVLTAAHCETYNGNNVTYVRLGQLDRSFENSKLYNVRRFTAHPSYKDIEKYNDIALIELDREVKFKPNIRPACLPKYVSEPATKLIATGFGATGLAGEEAFGLQKVVLEKFGHEECRSQYKDDKSLPDGINSRTQICAGSHQAAVGTCKGDGGGPLQAYHPSRYCMYTVIGVISSDQPCGKKGVPDIFTDVGAYLNWIEDIVWEGR